VGFATAIWTSVHAGAERSLEDTIQSKMAGAGSD
jgi:hypothetical protein